MAPVLLEFSAVVLRRVVRLRLAESLFESRRFEEAVEQARRVADPKNEAPADPADVLSRLDRLQADLGT